MIEKYREFLKTRPLTVGAIVAEVALLGSALLGWSIGSLFEKSWEGFGIALGLALLVAGVKGVSAVTNATATVNSDPNVQAQEAVEKYVAKWAKFLGIVGLIPLIGTVIGLLVFVPDRVEQVATEKAIDKALERIEEQNERITEVQKKLQESVLTSATSAIENITKQVGASQRKVDQLEDNSNRFDKEIKDRIEKLKEQTTDTTKKLHAAEDLLEEIKNQNFDEIKKMFADLKALPTDKQQILNDFPKLKSRLDVLDALVDSSATNKKLIVGDVMFQWGTLEWHKSTYLPLTFSEPFGDLPSVTCTVEASGEQQDLFCNVRSVGKSGFSAVVCRKSGSTVADTFESPNSTIFWIAVGKAPSKPKQ